MEAGLKARTRRRYKHSTDAITSTRWPPMSWPAASRPTPNQRWVGDTTELLVGESGAKMFLAVIADHFARYVVGWAVSAVNDRHLTLKALDMVGRRCPETGLLRHSDRGSPYAAEDYQDALEARGIICSMSRRGNCHDNAAMECWFSTLKFELGERFLRCSRTTAPSRSRSSSNEGTLPPGTGARRSTREGSDRISWRRSETVYEIGSSPPPVASQLPSGGRRRPSTWFGWLTRSLARALNTARRRLSGAPPVSRGARTASIADPDDELCASVQIVKTVLPGTLALRSCRGDVGLGRIAVGSSKDEASMHARNPNPPGLGNDG